MNKKKKTFSYIMTRKKNLWTVLFIFQDFHEEHALQAFRKYDKDNCGNISAKDFEHLMVTLKSFLLSEFVRENIVTGFL
jgi:Ca2+-binding EF-hand superfamily protein